MYNDCTRQPLDNHVPVNLHVMQLEQGEMLVGAGDVLWSGRQLGRLGQVTDGSFLWSGTIARDTEGWKVSWDCRGIRPTVVLRRLQNQKRLRVGIKHGEGRIYTGSATSRLS
ncbi:hypothetical protein PPACK8108_LOCUS617 [Phakopsora pachyrhizi]|uniref:Uncharacterized protein n=1 Tax=Phakopsora pachyrhizi TaxID=170000 RepID=A0AAV0AFR0_PHAPC|nr:hypothetical protein PPACK8108_LOCUS617 [Phakopsora pachyrhizi]